MYLLVSGGYPNKDYFQNNEGYQFEKAFLKIIDWESRQVVKELDYESPPEHSDPGASMIFRMGAAIGKEIVIPSNTEILFIDINIFTISRVISHISFNDLHHVTVKNKLIYITNTGLEMIQVMDFNGNILKEYPLVDNPTWRTYPEDTDFRFVGPTKPHYVHANYTFFLDNEAFCTRLLNKDAISLHDPSKRIDLNFSTGGPHDGKVYGDHIFFTLTDGYILIANKATMKIEEIIDLNSISNKSDQLGWCRGLAVKDGCAFVGFTQIRKSKFAEYGSWIIHGKKKNPARIAQYDLEKKVLISERSFFSKGAAIFTVETFDFETE